MQEMASVDTNPKAGKTANLSDGEGEVIDPTPSMSPAQASTDSSPKRKSKEGSMSRNVVQRNEVQLKAKEEVGINVTPGKKPSTPAPKPIDEVCLAPKAIDEVCLAPKEIDGVSLVMSDSVRAMSKKQVRRLEKEAKRLERAAKNQQKSQHQGADPEDTDPFRDNYGDAPQYKWQIRRSWTEIGEISQDAAGQCVLVRGRVHAIRPLSKKIVFLILRDGTHTVQCTVLADVTGVSPLMIRFATNLTKESLIDVHGTVSIPNEPPKSTTQKVEIQVQKIYCVNRAVPNLPFNFEDAARTEENIPTAKEEGEKLVRVNLETRLNNRPLDLRIPTNQSIFRIQSEVVFKFNTFMRDKEFVGIHTPKITPGLSEGGAAVFNFYYTNNQLASLAQSPQIYKQMAIHGGFKRVFEVGPVFRAEKSNTHRHLCEYIGLHVEMEIKDHYFEVCDIVDELFVNLFKHLEEKCKEDLEVIKRQHPFEPIKYLNKTLKLRYDEGIDMLKEAGFQINYREDLNTEAEKKLGQLVRDKYATDFFILYEYPLALRPFYTMPCLDRPEYSNSFDVFLRGEEIISGSQRIHTQPLLCTQIKKSGIDSNPLKGFIESFDYAPPPHGEFGAGLERIVMLYCGLDNIRKASMFPRDPRRLFP